MFKEYTYECQGGNIKYEIKNDTAIITSCTGKPYEIKVPGQLSGYPVTIIGKKAFLGIKTLKQLTLPSGIIEIGDWAFSGCSSLESITIEGDQREIKYGQSVFSKMSALRKLCLFGETEKSELLAVAVTQMDAQYLILDSKNFFEFFDVRLKTIIKEADDEGFVFMVLCGEEDLAADIDEYKENKREFKASLALLRIINDTELSDEMYDLCVNYIKEHTAGAASEASFKVLLGHSEDERYQNLIFSLNLIDDSNLERALEILGERYAPLKAKLLSGKKETEDFYSGFEL